MIELRNFYGALYDRLKFKWITNSDQINTVTKKNNNNNQMDYLDLIMNIIPWLLCVLSDLKSSWNWMFKWTLPLNLTKIIIIQISYSSKIKITVPNSHTEKNNKIKSQQKKEKLYKLYQIFHIAPTLLMSHHKIKSWNERKILFLANKKRNLLF